MDGVGRIEHLGQINGGERRLGGSGLEMHVLRVLVGVHHGHNGGFITLIRGSVAYMYPGLVILAVKDIFEMFIFDSSIVTLSMVA